MSVQRDVDDPERIGPVRHPDDCDCEGCNPKCPGCFEPISRDEDCCRDCFDAYYESQLDNDQRQR